MKDEREVIYRIYKNEAGNVEVSLANEEGPVVLPEPLRIIAYRQLKTLTENLLALKPYLRWEPMSQDEPTEP